MLAKSRMLPSRSECFRRGRQPAVPMSRFEIVPVMGAQEPAAVWLAASK
jgi:hypothetical protein